jgi:prepilin-type N-terminal cleavage/methylation domain-containing protein
VKGFALTETLVALAIAGLVVTALLWLQVDYIALARRAMAQTRPGSDAALLLQQAKAFDNCAQPKAVLARTPFGLAAREGELDTPVMGLPARVEVRTAAAPGPDGQPRGGWSSASIERGGATIAVIALRCDLPELCNYDMAKGQCRGS